MRPNLLECSFLIPQSRDKNLSDAVEHDPETWDWLSNELYLRFGAGTLAPGVYQGFYEDPDTHQRVVDESRRFIVAIAESRMTELRLLLLAACVIFQQKCIYLSVAGHVEFIKPPQHV